MKTRLLLCLALIVSLAPFANANDIEPGKEFYTATRAANPIAIDGDLSEWEGVPVLADPRFSVPKGSGDNGTLVLFEEYNGGSWTGPDDHTSAVQVIYDSDNVYFGFVVTDDYHENSANSAWNGDSVQLMIANSERDNIIALYNYALGGVEDALGDVIVQHESGPGQDPACECETEAVITRDVVSKKTTYEIRLPLASLDLTELEIGTEFGLGMAINDGDGEPGQNGQKGWGGLGAHSIVFGKSPEETALVTLGEGGPGEDRLFFAAVNPTFTGFSFRATDKGISIVDPDSVKLSIDDQEVSLTAGPKTGDFVDFSFTFPAPYPPGSEHTYLIEADDTRGNTVTAEGTFRTENYALLTSSHKALSVDTGERGFTWRVFQNEDVTPDTLAEAELILAGELKDEFDQPVPNMAWEYSWGAAGEDGVMEGHLMRFDIPTVINLNVSYFETSIGNFVPDDPMPGVPGMNLGMTGIQAEVVTFIELPEGLVTMGVNSDDGFRTQAGFINSPADGVLAGEFDGSRGAADTLFRLLVQEAGVYGFRTIYQQGVGDGNIEWFTVKSDGSKVLVNDTENGGLTAYRVGVAPDKQDEFFVNVQISGQVVEISWTESGVLQESADLDTWIDLPNATSPHKPDVSARASVFFRLKR